MSEYIRGTQATFTARFFEYDGSPMIPVDRESWPAVVIRDPENTVIVTGIAVAVAEGQYQFNWFVPVDAEMSTVDDSNWAIEWAMVTSNGHTHAKTETFQIVDRVESTPEERSHIYLTNAGGMFRALIRCPRQLCEVSFTMKNTASATSVLHAVYGVATNDFQRQNCNPNRRISEMILDGEYVYYYDIGNVPAGEYQIHWNILESPVSERRVEVQILCAVPDMFWHYNAEIRTRIDRLQKSTDMVQAYTDADIYSYLRGGLDILNFIAPPTNFLLTDIPIVGSSGLRTALIYTSMIDAIIAQQILEVELSFDHSGQTVTLNYNHDYSGVLGNIQTVLDKFAEAKIHVFRRANGAAFSGVRPKNYRLNNRVYKLDAQLGGIVPPGGASLWGTLGV